MALHLDNDAELAAFLARPGVAGIHGSPRPRAATRVSNAASAVLTPTDGAKLLLQAILDAGVPGIWYREFTFHEARDWRLDVACPARKVGVEVDGGAHRVKGRFLRDIEKHNALMFAGWRYLRCTPQQVRSGEALALIRAYIGE